MEGSQKRTARDGANRRRALLAGGLVAAVLLLGFTILRGLRSTGPGGPNLIIVVLDTLRADRLAAYGAPRTEASPNLSRFAAESVLFAAHRSHSARTGPSIATLITGLYPPAHGVVNPIEEWDSKGRLGKDRTTLAEILQRRGYQNYGLTANLNVAGRFGFDQGFEVYEHAYLPAEKITRWAEFFLQGRDRSRPFFLYLHYMETHSPYHAPPPFDKVWIDPAYEGELTGGHAELDRVLAGEIPADAADMEHLRNLYDQELTYFDHWFARLLERIKTEGLDEDTVIVFVSDHGEEFGEHGGVLHGYTVYEEQLRVPLIIRAPGVGPGRVSGETFHIDFLPTILELMGVPAESRPPRTEFSGLDLSGVMRGEPGPPARPFFASTRINAVRTVDIESVTAGGLKLIADKLGNGPAELYDLAGDPGERSDLSRDRPEDVGRLTDALAAFDSGITKVETDLINLSDEERETMKALGYLK